MDPLRFRTYYTGLVCGLRVRVWTVAGLDSMIKCGFLYVKLWNMIVIPLVKKRLREFQEQLSAELAASPRKNAVYGLLFNFFDLTENMNA